MEFLNLNNFAKVEEQRSLRFFQILFAIDGSLIASRSIATAPGAQSLSILYC